jgi:hypothetical protein
MSTLVIFGLFTLILSIVCLSALYLSAYRTPHISCADRAEGLMAAGDYSGAFRVALDGIGAPPWLIITQGERFNQIGVRQLTLNRRLARIGRECVSKIDTYGESLTREFAVLELLVDRVEEVTVSCYAGDTFLVDRETWSRIYSDIIMSKVRLTRPSLFVNEEIV